MCATLLLTACNSIERRVDRPSKKTLESIVNPFSTKKIWGKKIADLKTEYTLN